MYFDDFDSYRDENDEEIEDLEGMPCTVCPLMCPFSRSFQMPPFPPPTGGNPGPPGAPGQGSSIGPPPSYVPKKPGAGGMGIKAVEPGGIRPCKNRFVYIWLDNGRGFWAWLTFVGRRSVAGWRWNGRRWVYFGVDMRRIDRFICI